MPPPARVTPEAMKITPGYSWPTSFGSSDQVSAMSSVPHG